MANFATAALVKAQAKLIKQFQAGELRFRDPAIHKLFLMNTEIMIPDYVELRTREDRVVETNFLLRTTRALGTGRSFNHTGDQGDSGILTPSFTTFNDKFVSTLKEADNKVYSLEELHQSKLINVIANFAEGLETVASDFLFASRSGVNVSTADGAFDAVDDVFEITESTEGERAIQITASNLGINKWQNMPFDIVADTIAWGKFMKDVNQGTGNATNTSYQFPSGMRIIEDPKLTADAAGLVSGYADGFWIAIPRGTIAALPWIPIQNREGKETKENSYGTINNPIDFLNYAIHTYEERVDGTPDGGFTQDLKTETEISLDIAFEIAPLSNAGETPVLAFAFV